MKKLIITIAAAVALTVSYIANAQEVALPKGSSVTNAGIGFSTSINNIGIPPIYVQYEYIIEEFGSKWSVGVGALGGFYSQKYAGSNIVGGEALALGDIHFSPLPALDLYAGLGLGIMSAAVEGIRITAFDYATFLGARYFFTDSIGANLQIGGMGTINIGIAFRL